MKNGMSMRCSARVHSADISVVMSSYLFRLGPARGRFDARAVTDLACVLILKVETPVQ